MVPLLEIRTLASQCFQVYQVAEGRIVGVGRAHLEQALVPGLVAIGVGHYCAFCSQRQAAFQAAVQVVLDVDRCLLALTNQQ